MKKIKIFFLKRAIRKNIAKGLRTSDIKLADDWDDLRIISELEAAIRVDRLYEIRRENGFMKDVPSYSKNYYEYKELTADTKP